MAAPHPKQSQLAVVTLSTYPPYEDGIATFAADLVAAECQLFEPNITWKVAAIDILGIERKKYPPEVQWMVHRDNREEYVALARSLNEEPSVACVVVQHEYGIFGGDYGSYVLDFLDELKKPAVFVFHTALTRPPREMVTVTQHIILRAQAIIVLSRHSHDNVVRLYRVPPEKIYVIPHGIHPALFTRPESMKTGNGMSDKKILTTFGFLGPGKGIEYVIQALPEVIKKYPESEYWLIGRTHPMVEKESGESYRESLMALAKQLGVAKHVKMFGRYMSVPEILRFLALTDVYVATSPNPDQTVSGTFSYALGSGRCVVSTKFAQAKEMIVRKNMGILVNIKRPAEFSRAMLQLLDNPRARSRMQERAYHNTRSMLWQNVALSYMDVCSAAAPDLATNFRTLPPLSTAHLLKMTDDFGMFQFSRGKTPDPSSGYTLDDNARALLFAVEYYRRFGDRTMLPLIAKYLKFIGFCQAKSGVFANYVDMHRTIIEPPEGPHVSLDDANGRALWALSAMQAEGKLSVRLRREAAMIWKRWKESGNTLQHPRAKAFFIHGLAILPEIATSEELQRRITAEADALVALYRNNTVGSWGWFERRMTYANGILPSALLESFRIVNRPEYREIGLRSLEFLMETTFRGEIYVAIGQQGWHIRNKMRADFDQQPEEPFAMMQALAAAYRLTGEERYRERARRVFSWFLGNNLLGEPLYDRVGGGCRDGLTPAGTNRNEGAESTLSYLLARLLIQQLVE